MSCNTVSSFYLLILVFWIQSCDQCYRHDTCQIRQPESRDRHVNTYTYMNVNVSHLYGDWNSYLGKPTLYQPPLYLNSHSENRDINWWDLCINTINQLGLKPNMHPDFTYSLLPSQLLRFKRNQKSIIQNPGKSKCSIALICMILIIRAGDCELNPGPNPDANHVSHESSCSKFPCLICNDPCTWTQKSVQCDECDGWYHTQCMGVNTVIYEALGHSNVSWHCCACGLPNFSTSLFSEWSMELSNNFSSLDTIDEDDVPLSPPNCDVVT